NYWKTLSKAKLEAAQAEPKRLAIAKYEVARGIYEAREKEFLAGQGTLEFLLNSSRRLLKSERAVFDQPAEQVAALERYWERSKQIEDIYKGRFEAGRVSIQEYMDTRYARLEAELWLIEARAKHGKPRRGEGKFTTGEETSPLDAKEVAKGKRAA